MFQFIWFWNNFFFLQLFESGKFSTKVEKIPILSIGDEIRQTRRSRNRKQNFAKSGKFSTKSGKISTSAECSNSCDFRIIFFFFEIFRSGKFSTKVEKFLHLPSGMQFGKREGLDAEKKNSPKWKIFHQKWKNFHLCRMFQFMWFWNKNFFFGSGKFSTKVEKIPLPLFGIKLGVLVCPDEQKNFLPKWKIFHQKWKSCSTPRASLARAVLKRNT